MKKKLFMKCNVIMTTPAQGYYGVAIVLDDAIKRELSPGRFSYPLNHIAITPLIFTKPISMDNICAQELKPLVFTRYFDKQGETIFWRNEICVHIYTNRNEANLQVIGNIDPSQVCDMPLLWEPQDDQFHFCGDVTGKLGREAYIQYCRINNIDLKR